MVDGIPAHVHIQCKLKKTYVYCTWKIRVFEQQFQPTVQAVVTAGACLSLQAVQEKKKTAKAEAQRVSLQSLLHYLTHFKLSHAVRKNLLLIDNMKEMAREGKRNVKPEEFVRVYDILLQVS